MRYAGPIAYSTAPPVFGFQRVFVPTTPSCDVYTHAVERIALDVVEGFNGSILTYGQTGSGKTFTTLGLLPRVADTLFQVRSTQHHCRNTLQVVGCVICACTVIRLPCRLWLRRATAAPQRFR